MERRFILYGLRLLLGGVPVSSFSFKNGGLYKKITVNGINIPNSPDGKWRYNVYSTYSRLLDYNLNEATIVVPATLGGYPVLELGYGIFQNKTASAINMSAITGTLTLNDNYLFAGMANLTSIIWPKTVIFGAGSSSNYFDGTSSLTVLDLPENLSFAGTESYVYLNGTGGNNLTVNFKNSTPPPGPAGEGWENLFYAKPVGKTVIINTPSNWTGPASVRGITINKSLAAYSAGGGAVACFAPGTRVLTTAGYKAVEALSTGDKLVSSDGRALPFTLFKGAVITTEKSAPFIIKKNAFGTVPTADVRLSPIHTFQTRKGVWQTPRVAAQTNDKVVQESVGEEVTYYHIELPNYFTDNIVSEGLVVESFGARQVKGVNVYTYSNRLGGMTRSVPSSLKKHL